MRLFFLTMASNCSAEDVQQTAEWALDMHSSKWVPCIFAMHSWATSSRYQEKGMVRVIAIFQWLWERNPSPMIVRNEHTKDWWEMKPLFHSSLQKRLAPKKECEAVAGKGSIKTQILEASLSKDTATWQAFLIYSLETTPEKKFFFGCVFALDTFMDNAMNMQNNPQAPATAAVGELPDFAE